MTKIKPDSIKKLYVDLGVSTAVGFVAAFYDSLPLPSGGMYKIRLIIPWFFYLPGYLGLKLENASVVGLGRCAFAFGVFIQLIMLIMIFRRILYMARRII